MGFPQQLEVQEVVRDGVYWIALSGELDLASASLLQETVNDLAGEAISAVVLDLSGLSFLDSTGVRATLDARELCERRGYRFSLIPGPAQASGAGVSRQRALPSPSGARGCFFRENRWM